MVLVCGARRPSILIGLNLIRMLRGEVPDREHAGRVLPTVTTRSLLQRGCALVSSTAADPVRRGSAKHALSTTLIKLRA
jgi:hypothetical protein